MRWRIVPNPGHVWPIVSQDTPQGPLTWYPDDPDAGPIDEPGTTYDWEPLVAGDGSIHAVNVFRKDAAGGPIDVQIYRERHR